MSQNAWLSAGPQNGQEGGVAFALPTELLHGQSRKGKQAV